MKAKQKAEQFAKLHIKGKPVILYNVWDAGSAKAIVESGAKAVATSSWSVAEAQGYRDGESIPLALVEQIAARIAATVKLPVTVDFEGGYSEAEAGRGKYRSGPRSRHYRGELRGPRCQRTRPLRRRPASEAYRNAS
jgi:2-methylisocitrate lyase-like PEP mutase family enzyme